MGALEPLTIQVKEGRKWSAGLREETVPQVRYRCAWYRCARYRCAQYRCGSFRQSHQGLVRDPGLKTPGESTAKRE